MYSGSRRIPALTSAGTVFGCYLVLFETSSSLERGSSKYSRERPLPVSDNNITATIQSKQTTAGQDKDNYELVFSRCHVL